MDFEEVQDYGKEHGLDLSDYSEEDTTIDDLRSFIVFFLSHRNESEVKS